MELSNLCILSELASKVSAVTTKTGWTSCPPSRTWTARPLPTRKDCVHVLEKPKARFNESLNSYHELPPTGLSEEEVHASFYHREDVALARQQRSNLWRLLRTRKSPFIYLMCKLYLACEKDTLATDISHSDLERLRSFMPDLIGIHNQTRGLLKIRRIHVDEALEVYEENWYRSDVDEILHQQLAYTSGTNATFARVLAQLQVGNYDIYT